MYYQRGDFSKIREEMVSISIDRVLVAAIINESNLQLVFMGAEVVEVKLVHMEVQQNYQQGQNY